MSFLISNGETVCVYVQRFERSSLFCFLNWYQMFPGKNKIMKFEKLVFVITLPPNLYFLPIHFPTLGHLLKKPGSQKAIN